MPTKPWGTAGGLRAGCAWVRRARTGCARAGTATASAQPTTTKSIPADRLRHDIGASVARAARSAPADHLADQRVGEPRSPRPRELGRAPAAGIDKPCTVLLVARRGDQGLRETGRITGLN